METGNGAGSSFGGDAGSDYGHGVGAIAKLVQELPSGCVSGVDARAVGAVESSFYTRH